MNLALLQRLASAQTEEERSWIVTESLLETLSADLAAAAWAVVIPHWFDVEVLAALRPQLQDRADQLYAELQQLSFVEMFPGRGHNVHERTRKLMLTRLWQQDPQEFKLLSERATAYFAQAQDTEGHVEWLYHLAVSSPQTASDELFYLAQSYLNDFRRAEVESLLDAIQEQVAAGRTTQQIEADWQYWQGRVRFRFYQTKPALEHYQQAIELYRQVGARLGEANTLQAIGDVLQFLDRRTEALEHYQQAIEIFRQVGDRLGEANTLKAIGMIEPDLEVALNYCQTALGIYTQIGDYYSQSRNLLYFTSEVQLRLGQKDAAIASLTRAATLAEGTEFEFFQQAALEKIHDLERELTESTHTRGLIQRFRRWWFTQFGR